MQQRGSRVSCRIGNGVVADQSYMYAGGLLKLACAPSLRAWTRGGFSFFCHNRIDYDHIPEPRLTVGGANTSLSRRSFGLAREVRPRVCLTD